MINVTKSPAIMSPVRAFTCDVVTGDLVITL